MRSWWAQPLRSGVDADTVVFGLAKPMPPPRGCSTRRDLPKHCRRGVQGRKLAQPGDWELRQSRSRVSGLSAQEYVPGQHLTLERNPFYWKIDREKPPLHYLDQITFCLWQVRTPRLFTSRLAIRMYHRISADEYALAGEGSTSHAFRCLYIGQSRYNFLFFNLNSALSGQSDIARKHNVSRGKLASHIPGH